MSFWNILHKDIFCRFRKILYERLIFSSLPNSIYLSQWHSNVVYPIPSINSLLFSYITDGVIGSRSISHSPRYPLPVWSTNRNKCIFILLVKLNMLYWSNFMFCMQNIHKLRIIVSNNKLQRYMEGVWSYGGSLHVILEHST
jgi:hypothetical protein